jgi:hypothetical protein
VLVCLRCGRRRRRSLDRRALDWDFLRMGLGNGVTFAGCKGSSDIELSIFEVVMK